MRTVNKKLDSFTGGGYANSFKLQLDTGPTYEEIVLKLENIDIEQVTAVELILNGDSIIAVTGQHFKDLAAHLGEPPEAGKIRIPFRDYSLMTDAGQSLTSLVTLNTDNLVLIVRLAGATSAQVKAGDVPGLSGYAILSAGRAQRVLVPRIYQENIAIGMTGENNVKTMMPGPIIRRAFFEADGRMTNLRLKRSNAEVFDCETVDNDQDLERKGFKKLTGKYIFSPIMTRFGLVDGFQTANSKIEIMPTVDSAGDMAVIMHTLEVAGNPTVDPISLLASK
jgi:hypothetical protein